MQIRKARTDDQEQLIHLIAEFRVTLAQFRGPTSKPNLDAARRELAEYQSPVYPVFVAESDDSRIVGYLVCRVDGDVVWAEQLFVLPEYRREGVGSALYSEAERLCQEVGGDTLYNWVHPNNDTIISFLQKRGYSVLNLIELRRAWPGEKPEKTIKVGDHEFDY
jgi:ribosomal protein S18 acetylase RimI-like enzyme